MWHLYQYGDYKGYETLDSLYKDVVTSDLDYYNHQDNVDESVAPVTVKTTTDNQ